MPSSASSIGVQHQRILQDLHRELEPEDQDQAMIAIIDAMEFYSDDRHWWNEKSIIFDLVEGQQAYSLAEDEVPPDLVRPRSLQVNLTGNWSEPLPQVPIEDIRYWTYNDTVTTGYPTIWAWYAKQLWFYRIPNGVYQCRFDYVADVNRPRYRVNGTGGWVFEMLVFNSGSGQFEWVTLTPEYTNEWLDNTARMIRTRAKLDLYANFYDDAKQAQRMSQLLSSEESSVRKATQNLQSQIAIQPTPLSTSYFSGE